MHTDKSFNIRYKDLGQTEEKKEVASSISGQAEVKESALSTWKMKRGPRQQQRQKDELEAFTTCSTIETENPRLWWIQHQKDYPQLSRMALDLLAIPAMSSEVERVFSSTGMMVTDRRNRLKEDVIEAVECMKSWGADSGIVSFKDTKQVHTMLEQLAGKSKGKVRQSSTTCE